MAGAVAVYPGQGNSTGGPRDRLLEAETILRDSNRGMTPGQLMEKYGISKATLYRRLNTAVQARLAPTVDEYRERQNAHLDDMLARWEQQVAAADILIEQAQVTESWAMFDRGVKMRETALQGILRVAERRARLMGTDAPVKADVSVTVTSATDAAIEQLAAQIGAA